MNRDTKFDRLLKSWDRTSRWLFRICVAVILLGMIVQFLTQFALFRLWMNPVEQLEGIPYPNRSNTVKFKHD